MRHKHSHFLFVLLAVLLFVPSALAYWVWSPTESKFLSPKAETSNSNTVAVQEPAVLPSKLPAENKSSAATFILTQTFEAMSSFGEHCFQE